MPGAHGRRAFPMSYKTYITEALVCGSRASNTSDKSYLLFTREAGMLYAAAKSVREERSKQRFALQEFSIIRVTLVHGKSGWRVTGAESLVNAYAIQETREARALVRNSIRLLRRLIRGEFPHYDLYDEMRAILGEVHHGNEELIEEVLTLRALNMLGYIAPRPELAGLLTSLPIVEIVAALDPATALLRKQVIADGLRESHL